MASLDSLFQDLGLKYHSTMKSPLLAVFTSTEGQSQRIHPTSYRRVTLPRIQKGLVPLEESMGEGKPLFDGWTNCCRIIRGGRAGDMGWGGAARLGHSGHRALNCTGEPWLNLQEEGEGVVCRCEGPIRTGVW